MQVRADCLQCNAIIQIFYDESNLKLPLLDLSQLKANDPQGLNWTFVLCYLYFYFCLELSPLVMNRHLTPNLYHLDAIWVHSLIQNLTFSTNQGKI